MAFNLNGEFRYITGVNVYDTTQGKQEIVDVYTNIEPGMGGRYTETKVFVRAELVEKYNFGKSDSDIILKNIKCTQEEIVINGGRGNVTLKGIKGIVTGKQ